MTGPCTKIAIDSDGNFSCLAISLETLAKRNFPIVRKKPYWRSLICNQLRSFISSLYLTGLATFSQINLNFSGKSVQIAKQDDKSGEFSPMVQDSGKTATVSGNISFPG